MRWMAVVLMLVATTARAELLIELVGGRTDAVPIAIVPFGVNGAVPPETIDKIVSSDLYRSGQFRPLPPEDMLSRPTRASEVAYRDFRVLGSDYLVFGSVQAQPDGRYTVSYELHDVPRGVKLMGDPYTVSAQQLRDVAHDISDRIYEKLTGIAGAFSTKILYVTHSRYATWPYELQYSDADGARATTIFRSKEPIMSPSWGPDNREVAYVSFEATGLPKVYTHNLYTQQRKVISSFSGINGAPDWSPDGTRMALTLSKDGNPEIYILDMSTGGLRRMTNHYAIDTEPRWLPDGRSLVFTSNRGGGPQIYKLSLDDGSVRRLTFEGDYNARPDITPDGRFLTFVHRRNGQFHIAVQDLKRGTFDVVTQTEMDESPSIAPNGSMILYATQKGGVGMLHAVSIDGRIKVVLPSKSGDVREPAWSGFKVN